MKLDPRSFKGLSRFLAPSAGGPLADRALAEKIITPEQLDECIGEQDRTGRPLDEILVQRGFLKVEEVTRLRQPQLPPEVVRAAEDPARQLGHYVLVSLLGTGGMAEVWKAWDRSLGRWVAVKYLKEGVGHPTQRIEREGRMAGGLSHPGIISIFERGQHDGRAYLVMPYVDGQPPRAPLPPREAARLAREVAAALTHAHAMGVIHRDVKPGNILVGKEGRIVVTDFGLAIPGDSATSRWAMSGTPEYASPEQVRGEKLDARTDIYSLGATLYHLLMGRPPFIGRDLDEISEQVLKAPPPPLRGVPQSLASAVRKAMARDRRERYASMGQFAEDLWKYGEAAERAGRLRWRAFTGIMIAGLLPWLVSYILLARARAKDARLEVLEQLSEAQIELGRVEQLRADPAAEPKDLAEAAMRALPLFHQARDRAGGDSPEAFAGIGRCYEIMGKDDKAEAAYRDAKSLPAARVGLARVYLRRHLDGQRETDWTQRALSELEKFQPSGDDDPAIVLGHFAARRWEEVLAKGERVSDRNRYDELLFMLAGVAALELKDWDKAAGWLDQAARLRRSDATILYYRGLAHAGKGDRDQAAVWLMSALDQAPGGWLWVEDATKRLEALKR